jgi:hypothetical protein
MKRKIALVGKQVSLHNDEQPADDLQYWLSKKPQERLAAVTFLVRQNLKPNQRMDKSYTAQRKIKNDT